MSMTIDLDDIPGPKARPLVGNALDIDADNPIETFIGDGPRSTARSSSSACRAAPV